MLNTIFYNKIQYRTVQCGTVQWGAVQYRAVQYSAVQYSAVQYSEAQYSEAQYSAVQSGHTFLLNGIQTCWCWWIFIAQYYAAIQYYTVLYSIMRYYAVILYFMSANVVKKLDGKIFSIESLEKRLGLLFSLGKSEKKRKKAKKSEKSEKSEKTRFLLKLFSQFFQFQSHINKNEGPWRFQLNVNITKKSRKNLFKEIGNIFVASKKSRQNALLGRYLIFWSRLLNAFWEDFCC